MSEKKHYNPNANNLRENLVQCFQDTYKWSFSELLQNYTYQSINSNIIYPEDFRAFKSEKGDKRGRISLYKLTTFAIAQQYCPHGRTAVLNFANPENPGGGVRNGAMAQEECLCRSSNLYACISHENVFQNYYNYHRTNPNNYLYSDRLIYTKDVVVFKNDAEIPQILPQNEWFSVDVITCAAPYIAMNESISKSELFFVIKKRIKNIFETAIENQIDNLILGAFGCGAFKNPPTIVASAFLQVIKEEDYFREFKNIVFAIKPTGLKCQNFEAFSRAIANERF